MTSELISLQLPATEEPQPPVAWKVFVWRQDQRVGLCHSDQKWYEAPDGTWLCGTCHPEPWNGWKPKEMPK